MVVVNNDKKQTITNILEKYNLKPSSQKKTIIKPNTNNIANKFEIKPNANKSNVIHIVKEKPIINELQIRQPPRDNIPQIQQQSPRDNIPQLYY